MVARHRHRRLLQTGSGWTTPGQFGEIQVNPVRRRLALVDADGSAVEPIGIPLYDARSQYAIGDFVVRGATILRCTTAIGAPHAFNAAEWVEAGKSQADLKTFFDTVYSALGHNHDAAYAPLVHNHDLVYAPLVHNHDALYAPLVHNHDSVYGRLAAANTWTAGQNFLDIVNLQGTYTAVYGNLSVACGAGGFVPTIQGADIRGTGTTSVRVIANGSDQQARLELNNSVRDWLWYTQGGALIAHDLTAGAQRARIDSSGNFWVLQAFTAAGVIQSDVRVRAGGVLTGVELIPNGPDYRVQMPGGGAYVYRTDVNTLYLQVASANALSIDSNGLRWEPSSHTFLTDGIIRLRAFADAGLPSVTTYANGLIWSTTVSGRLWGTNDGATWKRIDMG